MNQIRPQASSSRLHHLLLLLVIMVAAEAVVAIVIASMGGALTAENLVASVARILLVAVGGWFLFAHDTDAREAAEPVTRAETTPQAPGDNQVWPNIDELTHTLNQRGLTIHLLEMIALAERYSHRLSVCMIRLDGLDELAEEEREDALIGCSALLMERVRIPDKAGRYEDNLFMIIMPEADYTGANVVASRLENSLDKELSGQARISIGVAEFEHGDDLQRLLGRAQKALDKDQQGDK